MSDNILITIQINYQQDAGNSDKILVARDFTGEKQGEKLIDIQNDLYPEMFDKRAHVRVNADWFRNGWKHTTSISLGIIIFQSMKNSRQI